MRKVRDMPTNYLEAHNLLGGKDFKVIANNTWLRYQTSQGFGLGHPERIELGLHGTVIVAWPIYNGWGRPDEIGGPVILNSGGYRTVTTKARINACLRTTRFGVYQENYAWHVHDHVTDVDFDFEDGMVLNLDRDQTPR